MGCLISGFPPVKVSCRQIKQASCRLTDRFMKQIEKQTGQRVKPIQRGGDRKSKEFKGN